jgi:uncharacterized Zn finger protein
MVQPFWEGLQDRFKDKVEPELFQEGMRLFSEGKATITSVKKGRIDLRVIDEDGKKYKIVQKREILDYNATNTFARKLASDKESYEALIQNKTPANITDILIELGTLNHIRNNHFIIKCSCGMGISFCRHQVAAILQIIAEIPVKFPVCLGYFGIDQAYVNLTIRDEISRKRKIQISYTEFWYGVQEYNPENVEGFEPEKPGVWHRGAPAPILLSVPDIEEAREKAAEEAAELLKKLEQQEKVKVKGRSQKKSRQEDSG